MHPGLEKHMLPDSPVFLVGTHSSHTVKLPFITGIAVNEEFFLKTSTDMGHNLDGYHRMHKGQSQYQAKASNFKDFIQSELKM